MKTLYVLSLSFGFFTLLSFSVKACNVLILFIYYMFHKTEQQWDVPTMKNLRTLKNFLQIRGESKKDLFQT